MPSCDPVEGKAVSTFSAGSLQINLKLPCKPRVFPLSLHGASGARMLASMTYIDEDIELVRLAQAGQEHAFEALVVKYQRRIARHVARYLKTAADVEDAVQEVFMRV